MANNDTSLPPESEMCGRALKPRPLRRIGAVLDTDDARLLVWIPGVTAAGGEWLDKRYLPATLHDDEATFEVWLYDGEPIMRGAYTLQVSPTTGAPYTDEELFALTGARLRGASSTN